MGVHQHENGNDTERMEECCDLYGEYCYPCNERTADKTFEVKAKDKKSED